MVHVNMSYSLVPKPCIIIVICHNTLKFQRYVIQWYHEYIVNSLSYKLYFKVILSSIMHSSLLQLILSPLLHSWLMLRRLCFNPSTYNTSSIVVNGWVPTFPIPIIIPLLLSSYVTNPLDFRARVETFNLSCAWRNHYLYTTCW